MGVIQFLKNIFRPTADDAWGFRKRSSLMPNRMERFDSGGDPVVARFFTPADLTTFLSYYTTSPWVFVCASAIASAAASVKFQVLRNGAEIELNDPESPVESAQFLLKPNVWMTWYDLVETTFLHLELAGNCYWEVDRDKTGNVTAIYPLRPDRMRIDPDPKIKVKAYVYTVNGDEIRFAPSDILHLKYTDPANEFYGCAPIFSAKSDITLDFWITNWNKSFLKRGALPGGVIETPNALSDQAWQRLRATWNKFHGGFDKANSVGVLEEGMHFNQISSNHTEMQYGDQKKWSRDVILSVMRVPPVMVGLTEGVSYATSRDQKKIFWQDNIIPKLMKLQEAIDTFLFPEDLYFKFVTRSIDSIVEDDEVKSKIANQNVSHGIMTINEVRQKYYGLASVPWGDGYWAPMGLAYVDSNQTPPQASPGKNPTMGGDPAATAGSTINTPNDAGLQGPSKVPSLSQKSLESYGASLGDLAKYELEKIQAPEPDWMNAKAVRNWEEWNLWKAAAGPDDRALRASLQDFFERQGERLMKRLQHQWPIHGPQVKKAAGDDEDTAPEIQDFFVFATEDAALRDLLLPEAQRLLQKYANMLLSQARAKIIAEVGIQPSFKLTDPRIAKFLQEYGGTRIHDINQTTASVVGRELKEAYEAGEDFKQVQARLVKIFGEGSLSVFRAKNIARTEIVTLTNTARHEAAVQNQAKKKRWICQLLPTSRQKPGAENHVDLHDTLLPLDEPFVAKNRSGVDHMVAPGDISASAENVCGCLCIAAYSWGTDEFADILEGR